MLNNKKLGSSFENEWASALQQQGGWVHKVTPAENGSQPFDILHIKDGLAYGWECKTVNVYKFPLSRVENNQYYTFKSFEKHLPISFIFKHKSGEIYSIEAKKIIESIDNGLASVDIREGEKHEIDNR